MRDSRCFERQKQATTVTRSQAKIPEIAVEKEKPRMQLGRYQAVLQARKASISISHSNAVLAGWCFCRGYKKRHGTLQSCVGMHIILYILRGAVYQESRLLLSVCYI